MPRQVGRRHFLSGFDWKAWPQFVGVIYILYSALTGRRGHISFLRVGWLGGEGGVRVHRFLWILPLGLYQVNNSLASIRPMRIVKGSLTTFLCFMFYFMSVHSKLCALAIMLSVVFYRA